MDIKKILSISGLSVKEFAESLYVSERTIWNWISGRPIPRQRQKQIRDIYGYRELPAAKSAADID